MGCECEIKKCMEISDASPIQFWKIDCDTFNMNQPEGMFKYKFCAPWQCDDTITIPGIGYVEGETYDLVAYDENETELYRQPFSRKDIYKTQVINSLKFSNESFQYSINLWDQLTMGGTGQPFAWDLGSEAAVSDGSVSNLPSTAAFGQSRKDADRRWPAGHYKVKVRAQNLSTGGSSPFTQRLAMYVSDSVGVLGDNLGYTSDIAAEWAVTPMIQDVYVEFDLPEPKEYIWFQFYKLGPGSGYEVMFTLYESLMLEFPPTEQVFVQTIFNASFVPENVGLCDKEVYFKVIKTSGTPDIDEWHSDAQNIKTYHPETTLIKYSNHRNYAGIDYSDISPDYVYQLRIPAVFNKQRLPQEGEDLQLSSNRMIALNSQIKVQKKLSTGRMPDYMHLKVALALSHQFLIIKDQNWVKGGENYEPNGEVRDTDALQKYVCWLTKKDYVVRNIL